MTAGQRIRAARIASGLTLRALAASISVPASNLSDIENDRRLPSARVHGLLVARLGPAVDDPAVTAWTWGKVEVMGHREHFGQYREVDGWIEVIEPAVDLPSEAVSPTDPTRVWEAVSKPEERHRYGKAAIFGLHEMSEEAARADRAGFRRSTFLAPDGEGPVEDIPF